MVFAVMTIMSMVVVKHMDGGCLWVFAVETGLVLVIWLVEVEVSYDSAATKMLAFTVVAIPKVSEPDLFEGLKVVLADG